MPTIAELATELGLDVSAFKPEAVAKWNGYLTDADTQYQSAKQLQADSESNLRRVQQEQDEINRYIEQYGASEQTNAALRANNAAMEAQLQSLKGQGIAVEIPTSVPTQNNNKPAKNEFDADQFRNQVGSTMADGFNLVNKYQALYGKPLTDDINTLATEAKNARKPLYQYAAEKYDFAGEEKRKSDAAAKAHDESIAAAAVKKYQEDNPNNAGNPFQAQGGESRHPQILKPRDAKDLRSFANLSPREKIAQSVARSREALAANQA